MTDKTSATGGALIDLLPCPFCASNDLAVHEHCTGNSYMVLCHNCTGEGPLHETKQLAAEFWNRRAALARAGQPASELPALPEMDALADIDYAQQTPEDWDADYRATWQKLQVAERNKMQWRTYALDLRAQLASNREAYNAMALLANQTNMRRGARIKELEAQLASAQIDADLFRTVVNSGMQLHFEGRGEDDAVWVDELMKWSDGDRMAATRALIEECAKQYAARAQITNTTGN